MRWESARGQWRWRREREKTCGESGRQVGGVVVGNGKFNRRLLLVLWLWVVSLYG